ncbi:hypothetical protein ACJX0J_009506, partial [Zea mays]
CDFKREHKHLSNLFFYWQQHSLQDNWNSKKENVKFESPYMLISKAYQTYKNVKFESSYMLISGADHPTAHNIMTTLQQTAMQRRMDNHNLMLPQRQWTIWTRNIAHSNVKDLEKELDHINEVVASIVNLKRMLEQQTDLHNEVMLKSRIFRVTWNSSRTKFHDMKSIAHSLILIIHAPYYITAAKLDSSGFSLQ